MVIMTNATGDAGSHWKEIAKAFLKLGAMSYGGPAIHNSGIQRPQATSVRFGRAAVIAGGNLNRLVWADCAP